MNYEKNLPGRIPGDFLRILLKKEARKLEKEKRSTQPTPPDWEMVDPKPPVVQCGHLENRKEH